MNLVQNKLFGDAPTRQLHDGKSIQELREEGVSAADVKRGLGANFVKWTELRAAGYTAAELKADGFSWIEIKAAGYTPSEIKDLIATPTDLHGMVLFKDKGGYLAEEIKTLGYGPKELKAAGYSAVEIKKGALFHQ